MTQSDVDDAEVDPGFEQNGGMFVEPTVLHGSLERALHATPIHRAACSLRQTTRHGPARRKEPDRMAVCHPVRAQHGQCVLGQRDRAVFTQILC